MTRFRGFSLLEALIALLVIAVGLLGIASMQAASVYLTHVGTMNGLAAVEAQSISAAMTANQNAFPTSGTYPYNTSDAYAVAASVDCAAGTCDTNQMAAYDLHNWGLELRQDLPQGKGQVQCDGLPDYQQPQCTIRVVWLQKTMAPGAGTHAPSPATVAYSVVAQP